MKEIIEQLYQLQQAEVGSAPNAPETLQKIQSLRQSIPEPILGHYDRLRARGKTGVGLVRNGVCTGCHMRLASGINAAVIRGDDVTSCDSCGRYLRLDPEVPAAASPPPPSAPAKRGRRRKVAEAPPAA